MVAGWDTRTVPESQSGDGSVQPPYFLQYGGQYPRDESPTAPPLSAAMYSAVVMGLENMG